MSSGCAPIARTCSGPSGRASRVIEWLLLIGPAGQYRRPSSLGGRVPAAVADARVRDLRLAPSSMRVRSPSPPRRSAAQDRVDDQPLLVQLVACISDRCVDARTEITRTLGGHGDEGRQLVRIERLDIAVRVG